MITTLFDMLGEPLPGLSSLVVADVGGGSSGSGRSIDVALSAPVNLAIWGSLTHLNLNAIYPHLEDRLPAAQLLELLGRCPDLRELKLVDIAFGIPDSDVAVLAVELRRLSTFHLNYLHPTGLCTYLLRHISIPLGPLAAFSPLLPLRLLFRFYDQIIISIYRGSECDPLTITSYDRISMIPVFLASIDISTIREFEAICKGLWNSGLRLPLSLCLENRLWGDAISCRYHAKIDVPVG